MIWMRPSAGLRSIVELAGLCSIAAVYVTNTIINRDLSLIEQRNSDVTCYGRFFELSCPNNSQIVIVDIYLGMKPPYHNCSNSNIVSTDCCQEGADDCLVEETTSSIHLDALVRGCSGRERCENLHHAEWGDMPTGACGFNLSRSIKYQSNYVISNYTCLKGRPDVEMCRVNNMSGSHMYLSNEKYPSSFVVGFYKCSCSITPASLSDVLEVNALDVNISKAVKQSLILHDDNGTSVNVAGTWNGYRTIFTTINRIVHLSFTNYNYEEHGCGRIWLEIKGKAKLTCSARESLPLPDFLSIKGHDKQTYAIFKNITWRLDINGTCANNMGCMEFESKRWIFVANGPCFNDGVERCLKRLNRRWAVVDILPPSTVTVVKSTPDFKSGPVTKLPPKQELLYTYLQIIGAIVGTLFVCLLAFAGLIYCQRRVCQTEVKRRPVSMELVSALTKGGNTELKGDHHDLFTVESQSDLSVLY